MPIVYGKHLRAVLYKWGVEKMKVKELYETVNSYGLIFALNSTFGRNIKVNIPFSKTDLEANIDDIGFSVRANNALKRTGLMTVRDVVDFIVDDRLMCIRNLGKKSYNEIKTRVLQYGYNKLSDREKTEFLHSIIECNKNKG